MNNLKEKDYAATPAKQPQATMKSIITYSVNLSPRGIQDLTGSQSKPWKGAKVEEVSDESR